MSELATGKIHVNALWCHDNQILAPQFAEWISYDAETQHPTETYT